MDLESNYMGCADLENGETAPTSLTRRGFMSGAAALGIALVGSLAGCATESTGPEKASKDGTEKTGAGTAAPDTIDEMVDVDVVVVGAGISGLSAAVQASENGNTVLVLEKAAAAGGNGAGTEGIFAVGSSLQKEQNIEIDAVDIIRTELEESQWRSSGALWYDMVSHSAENLDWLQNNGVTFSGIVDNYGSGLFNTMHWWADNAGAVGYVPAMQAAAEANGATFRFATAATSLIIAENGTVAGVYAQDDSGRVLQVNAKAVILASGGIGANTELLPEAGMPQDALDDMIVMCVPTVSGDGFTMARAAGCKSYLPNASIQSFCAIEGFPMDTEPPYSTLNCGSAIATCGLGIWVDQDAMRFTDESISLTFNVATPAITCMGNRESYVIFTQTLLDSLSADPADKEYLDAALETTLGKSVFEAESYEQLAELCELDPAILTDTIEMYNGFCTQGFDGQFGKPANFLSPLAEPPYYAAKISNLFIVVDGGIATNIRAEVINDERMPIPGLYAVGLDGAMLWHNVYTQNMPGTCVDNIVHPGRNAANSAKEYSKGIV